MTRHAVWAVLLAGGQGTRFWPLSRASFPKQFLTLGEDRSLLQRSFDRVLGATPAERIFVVAAGRYGDAIRAQLPELPAGNVLAEPSPRDTAPAVGLAALEIRRRDPRGVMLVTPTDHRIPDKGSFRRALDLAVERAGKGGLGTLGVTPDRPATSFGYLRLDPRARRAGARPVERFVEKPDAETARGYVEEGCYLWNAGIFVFRVDVFFEEMRRAAPHLLEGLEAIDEARSAGRAAEIDGIWKGLTRTSVDYALMEKASDVWTVPLDAGWDDVGSWNAAGRTLPRDDDGNASVGGEALFVETSGTTVYRGAGAGKKARLAVLVGVDDLIVVDTGDALLVCGADRAEEVKKAVQELRRLGREDLL